MTSKSCLYSLMKPQTTQCMYQTKVHVSHLSDALKGGFITTYIYLYVYVFDIHMYVYIIIMNNIIMNNKIRHLGNNNFDEMLIHLSGNYSVILYSKQSIYVGGSSNSYSFWIPNFIDFLYKIT